MFSQELNQAWLECIAPENGAFVALPNGKYVAQIKAVRVDEETTRQDKTLPPCIRYDLTITQGEFSGSKHQKQDFINGSRSLGFIKGDMKKLGCSIPNKLDDIGDALQMAVGLEVEIEIRRTTSAQGKEFINTYFNKIVSREKQGGQVPNMPVGNAFADTQTTQNDDLPF